ncbi:unnamed protein product [Phytophthora fragariaefolia]|uniref:Unnamed protein product n=1 Tax=Phytophthora fragariaefolia TaxID=1490495 RepID=A0A9W6XQN0_9STRA|nr:unnamed protein product [Phytophthora fragariaefolia]
MREQRLSCAYEFMTEMLKFMDATLDFSEQRQFVAVNGDFCSERFEIVPLPQARNVKRVFDAVEGFVSNMEISMSEVEGDITVRENDEPQLSTTCPVAQHRFVTTVANIIQMDTNNAAFAEYRPPGPGVEEVAFSINDPIDEDELYPKGCRTIVAIEDKSSDKQASKRNARTGGCASPRQWYASVTTTSGNWCDHAAPSEESVSFTKLQAEEEPACEEAEDPNREKQTGPFYTLTYLPKDPHARHLKLLRMKHERVQRAYDFMRERRRFMDTTTEYLDQKKFHATNGDLCSERFEVIPLPDAANIKAIVDALEYFVYNIEICISEVLGDITIRENDDPQRSSSVAQHRLVTTIEDVVEMDTNSVAFNEYIPAGPDHNEVGFCISDAVDEDEVFPYSSSRVRQDVTVITMVTKQNRAEGSPVIVLARWWCLRIRKSDIVVPDFAVARIQHGMEYVGAAMLAAARRASAGSTQL